MKLFFAWLDRLTNILAILAGVYLVWIFLAIVFQVVARSVFLYGSSHIFTFIEYGLLYITMAGAPWLVREKGHVYIEILTAAVSEQVRPILSRAVVGLVILICVIITYYGIEVTIRAFVRDEMDMRSLDMPRWMLMISMPICFGLMSLQFLRFVIGPETLHSGEAGMHE
ncbi:MAG: TRAP transporter small permease [Paracoccaceae bacterium]|jgi:TRAP-type C4-dicarboxylate transport system permease small subunit|nr:TRAP transporter small permease [Paracoccaceae bacterium]NCW14594.1 TRAP transporter small permease [Paracoccaceae bacterium]NDD08386.1 TRAP transporter small permease [Paracoccaceae bacterium]NDH26438.1 TRAP transporter small permease [Paracoccaceae bacterium]|tara:strand:- start:827 stop:1333 length:507 start_codon:yes stop_codon:yes gene_type:complete